VAIPDNKTFEELRELGWDRPYFDAEQLPESVYEHVAWLDVMGTGAGLTRSLPTVANFVCKLHDAALDERSRNASLKNTVRLYPVMDGLYAVTERGDDLRHFLRCVFRRVAIDFLKANQPHKRFLVRCGCAFGPVIHGSEIGERSSHQFRYNPEYSRRILLGGAMVQAYQTERDASPFGVAVHETARMFPRQTKGSFIGKWFRWWQRSKKVDAIVIPALAETLIEHFEWCLAHSHELDYKPDRISEHRRMAEEYFDFVTAPVDVGQSPEESIVPADGGGDELPPETRGSDGPAVRDT
jgi:hypothetical protein